MSERKAPKLATWMLKHFGCSPDTEMVIGDLVERYSQEQSRVWFWRQAITSLVGGFFEEAFAHKGLMLRALIAGWGGFLLFRGAIVEGVSYSFYIHYIHPSTAQPIIEGGRLVGYSPPPHWAFVYPLLFRFCIVLCSALTGRIAARVGGDHYKAALFSYAGSMLVLFFLEGGPPDFNVLFATTLIANVGAVLVAGLVLQPQRPAVS